MVFTRWGLQKGDVMGALTIVLVILGIGIFFLIAPKAPEVTYAPKEIAGSSLQLTGSTLEVTSFTVTAPEASFVTVHEAIGSAPGPVLGVSALVEASGEVQTIEVTLGETSWPPTKLIALLFVDDGDGVFEAGVDLPVSVDGAVIRVTYSPNTGEEVSPDSL